MGNSFKVQKGGSAIEQAKTAGVLLALMGIIALFIWPIVGIVAIVLGLIFFIASFAASE